MADIIKSETAVDALAEAWAFFNGDYENYQKAKELHEVGEIEDEFSTYLSYQHDTEELLKEINNRGYKLVPMNPV